MSPKDATFPLGTKSVYSFRYYRKGEMMWRSHFFMKSYFEGWYFKHQLKETSFALIPGVAKDERGRWEAFVQVLTEETSYYIKYPIHTFQIQRNPLRIKVGENIFTTQGMELHINRPGISLSGRVTYGEFHVLNTPIMGPFAKVPRMECNHEILSMYHTVGGNLRFNGKVYPMTDALGYIEKDWGHSFPTTYRWTQCIYRKKGEITSIFTAIAKIPYMGMAFTGTISCIYHQDKWYTFATYYGAKVLLQSDDLWIIKQGKFVLVIKNYKEEGLALASPCKGQMRGKVNEQLVAKVEYRLYESSKLLFCIRSKKASIEVVNEVVKDLHVN